MSVDRVLLVVGIVGLLGLGLLVGHMLPQSGEPVRRSFGESLWQGRRVDLMVQLGLVCVGAFGIRALLPPEDESE